MTAIASPFGEVVYGYSRSDALADGVLIEADPAMCKEAGIRIPVAISDHLWSVVNPDNIETMPGQSLSGRLWDLLWMFRISVGSRKGQGSDRLTYKVLMQLRREGCPVRVEEFQVLAVCGPGDQGEPVITLMFPEDD